MNYEDDIWMVKKIFQLSDLALIRMVNHLFHTEYADTEYVRKEWGEQGPVAVYLTIGCANRYEFRFRQTEGCLQIYAEDKGCSFHYADASAHSAVQVREPQLDYFGRNTKKQYFTTLEFPGYEQIVLPIYTFTLVDDSVYKLEQEGLIPFLPFLFRCFSEERREDRQLQESLKYFVIHDVEGILHESVRKGDLNVFDAQRLKQLCRRMAWKVLAQKRWMQNLELQELLLNALEVDLDLLEKAYKLELQKVRNAFNEKALPVIEKEPTM